MTGPVPAGVAQPGDVDRRGVLAAGVAEAHAAAAVGQAAKTFCEDLAAHPVEDHVGAVTAGQAARLRREVRGPVVDAVVQAEPGQAGQLAVAGRRGEDTRPGPFGQLDGGDTDPAGAGVHQQRLAGLEAAELEQRVVSGAEGDRYARGLIGGQAGRGGEPVP